MLAKMAKARFHFHAVPGDTLVYRTTIDDISKDGAIVSGTSHVGERLQAEVQIFLAHLDEAPPANRCSIRPASCHAQAAGRVRTSAAPAEDSPLEVPAALAGLKTVEFVLDGLVG